MTNEGYLEEIKTLLEVDDTYHDKKLNIIIKNTIQQLQNKIKPVTNIPSQLEYIVTEVAIKRFNRLGSEGLSSDSEDGHSMTWYNPDDDFKPYRNDIEDFKNENSDNKDSADGMVIFY